MAVTSKDLKALEAYKTKCELIAESTALNELDDPEEQKKGIASAKADYANMVARYFPHYAKSETPEFHKRIARKLRRNPKWKGWMKWARGHAKSVVANVTIPFWLWMNDDVNFMLIIGQNEDKAKILLSDLQAEFESNQRIINDFGDQVSFGNWESGFFRTKNGFIAKSLGMGQEPRGLRVGSKRPDYISCDDWETKETQKNPKRQKELANWLLASVIPAMDDGNRRVIIAQNKFAPQMIFDLIMEKVKGWEVDEVKAYNPVTYESTWQDKYPHGFFKDVEDEIGILACKAEYLNEPHVEGTVFKDEHIQFTQVPQLRHMDAIVGRWDVAYSDAATADFNAAPVWGVKDGKKYKLEAFTKRCKMSVVLDWICHLQKEYKSKGISLQFGFEAQFWNDEIYTMIEQAEKRNKWKLNLVKVNRSTTNKYDRIVSMLPAYQNGNVYYGNSLKDNNDNQEAIAQLKGIEPGYKSKDDAPDADQMCFEELEKFSRAKKSEPGHVQPRANRKY